jgi:O-antigen ligase
MSLEENHILIFLLIISAIGIGYTFIAFKKPFWALIFVPIGTYMGYFFQLFENFPVPFSLFQIALIYFVVIFSLNRLILQHFTFKTFNLEIEFLIFFLIIFASLLYSPNRDEGLFYAIRILVLLIMAYLIINSIQNLRQISIILYTIVAISLILSVLSIREGFLNPERVLWDYFSMGKKLVSRALVNQSDPNIFASHLFLPIFVLSSYIMTRENKTYHRLFGFIALVVICLGLISTFSRSAWITTLFGMMILVIIFRQQKLLGFFFILVVLAMIFFPFSRILVSNIVNRFLAIFAGEADPSTKVRILLGIGAINIITDSYLLGIGFRAFPSVITNYFSQKELHGVLEPHSVFYTVFAELGLFGFLIYVWILYRIGRFAYLNFKHSSDKIERSFSASLMVSYFSYILFYEFYGGGLVDNNLWMIISLIIVLKLFRKKRSNEPIPD